MEHFFVKQETSCVYKKGCNTVTDKRKEQNMQTSLQFRKVWW